MHRIDLRKGTGIVIGLVIPELLLRLEAQAAGVHQEQDALHPAILQQAIGRRDGREGLARAGGHLHQYTWAILGKGFVQVLNGDLLALAESSGIKRRETLHIIADSVRLFQQAAQRLRPEEIEHRSGTELHVVVIREADQLVRGLVGEADAIVAGDAQEGAACIAGGLILHGGDALAGLRALGLHHAHRASVHEQGIVHLAGAGGKLPNGHAGGGSQVERIHVLNDPSRLLQLFVDDKPRALLG